MKYFKYVGLVIVIFSAGTIRYKLGLYNGYFDGYEQGFIDAATSNCDYWDEDNDFHENMKINMALAEIEENEQKISEENKQARAEEIRKGFEKLLGWVLTWRKLK